MPHASLQRSHAQATWEVLPGSLQAAAGDEADELGMAPQQTSDDVAALDPGAGLLQMQVSSLSWLLRADQCSVVQLSMQCRCLYGVWDTASVLVCRCCQGSHTC